jgi:hypothetical protein
VDRFEGVGLHSPFLEPDLDCEEMGLKFLGGYGGSLSDLHTYIHFNYLFF